MNMKSKNWKNASKAWRNQAQKYRIIESECLEESIRSPGSPANSEFWRNVYKSKVEKCEKTAAYCEERAVAKWWQFWLWSNIIRNPDVKEECLYYHNGIKITYRQYKIKSLL